jgi:prepilin-type N-terminal cleavage/methylation domain-containing protein
MRHTIGTRFAKAFTIIELLVVISIIGILATIVLAPLSTSRAKGRDARRIAVHRARYPLPTSSLRSKIPLASHVEVVVVGISP